MGSFTINPKGARRSEPPGTAPKEATVMTVTDLDANSPLTAPDVALRRVAYDLYRDIHKGIGPSCSPSPRRPVTSTPRASPSDGRWPTRRSRW